MEIVKHLTPAEEMIRDLNRTIEEMTRAANEACEREEERSRQWCTDRWRRLDDETRDIRARRDAMLKAWSDSLPPHPGIISSANSLT